MIHHTHRWRRRTTEHEVIIGTRVADAELAAFETPPWRRHALCIGQPKSHQENMRGWYCDAYITPMALDRFLFGPWEGARDHDGY